ncbi:MAG: hypothetical protein ACXW2G_02485 [Burkholderiaceae bacterium]
MNASLDASSLIQGTSRWATAAGCWFVAGCFLVAWWWPRLLDDGRWVKFGVGVLLFEFLTIHATGIFAGLRQKGGTPRSAAWLVVMYVLMALAMAAAFKSWVLLVSFGMLLASRVRSLFHPEDRTTAAAGHRRMAVSALLFLALAFATVFVPLPVGGLDAALLNEAWPGRGGGLWEQRPQQALAMGFVYFLVLGWVESQPPGARWFKGFGPDAASNSR